MIDYIYIKKKRRLSYTAREDPGKYVPRSGKTKIAVSLLIIFFLVLALTQVFLSAKMASQSDYLLQREAVKKALLQDNSSLRTQVNDFSSLRRIEEKAKALGFVKVATNILYLRADDFLAQINR